MAKVRMMDARMARFVVDSPDARIPYASGVGLIERAASLAGDASYGLRLGASRDLSERGVLGFLMLNSPTLLDAMINVQRFYKIAREDGELEVERIAAWMTVRFRESDPALRGLRHNADFIVGTLVRAYRDMTRQAICPIRVEFIHAEPTEQVEYADILGCPVKFQAEWTSLIYDEETARLPVQGADAKLLPILELACQKVVGPPTAAGQDLVREVRQLIIERLPTGSANFDAIAEVLKMSTKTLERRLGERGQSFSALLDATRYETVKHYLEETEMGLSQVAYVTGYTEPAALVRAFKRWTGETPMKFRDRLRQTRAP